MMAGSFYRLIELVGVGLLLSLVSRIWFARYLMGGLLSPVGRYFRWFYQGLRTPGNLAHELGHVAGFLVAGFRVSEVRFWFNDPAGRGYVRPGRAYAPWGRPFLASLLAAPAPLLAGALLLQACAGWLDAPIHLLFGLDLETLSRLDPGHWKSAWGVFEQWVMAPWGILRAVGFGLCAVSVGLEIAPSAVDARALAWPLIGVGALLALMGVVTRHWQALEPALAWIDLRMAWGLHWVAAPLWGTLAILVTVGLVLTPVRWLVAGWRT